MKKITIILTILFVTTVSFSQQIGDGLAPGIDNFSTPLNSGLYSGINAIGGIPDTSHIWSHLFVIRHGNPNNHFQLQIASSYVENERLFFRKLAGTSNSAWVELATRGTNSFTGNQIIGGNVGIGTLDITSQLSVGYNHGILLSIGNLTWAKKSVIETGWHSEAGDFTDLKVAGYGNNDAYLRIVRGGNIGIGTINPKNKLDVNGTIHSKEVKVDMLGWSDFVFKKEYNLPTLADVEKHINEKGHLENIPSEREVLKNGINLGEMNAKLLQKIEELTLYMIEIKKENVEMKNRLLKLEKK
ncbi:hypothetical protein [Flavobacterium sp. C3NV]|uniref:hypothetical protein n=1 Tax=Flavobacterium sp. C3NV TaxID=3393358 RepID=UPI00398FA20D